MRLTLASLVYGNKMYWLITHVGEGSAPPLKDRSFPSYVMSHEVKKQLSVSQIIYQHPHPPPPPTPIHTGVPQ